MCTYLAKRGATYYFRRAIPAELRPAMEGRVEFMLSLRTKDRAEAKLRIPAHTSETDRLLAEAACASPVRRATVARANMPLDTFERQRFDRDQEAAAQDAQAGMEREARQEARRDLRSYWRDRMALSTQELTPAEAAVKDLIGEQAFDLDLAQGQIAGLRSLLSEAIASGNTDCIARPIAPATIKPAEPTGTMLDTNIIDLWAAERKPVQKGIDTHRAVARWFYERVGRKEVAAITRADVLAFKAKLVEEGATAANIRMKLSRLRTLLQWAADNDHATANVAHGITIKDPEQAKNKRREFDLASLNSIFASPVYADGARPVGGKGEAAYWLPLMALFTGARLEELGQLRPKDIARLSYPDADGQEQAAWFIRIVEDEADDLKLKNAASERLVPVHSELDRLGFIAFVEAASKAGQERLFPGLKPNIYGRLTAKWGEWFGPYLRNICSVTDKRLVFHSFRHTFKHYARHGGIIEGVQRQIMGHSSGDVADQYGSGYPLHQVVEGMKQFRVPGLKSLPSAIR